VRFFVTGTDTGVGKTHTVTQLLRLRRAEGRRCAGMKPICCGDRQDAEQLLSAGSDGLTLDEINPVWLKSPAAPLVAARLEGFEFQVDAVVRAFTALRERFEEIFVEGVGGWLVPITSDFYVSDLAVALGLPVLLVARNKLGCLNHTLLTLESIRQRGLTCAGVVLNAPEGGDDLAMNTNADVLRQLCRVPIVSGLSASYRAFPAEWGAITGQSRV
jgi:dethiobiotin synthetase